MLKLDVGGFEIYLKVNEFREDLPDESEYDNYCYMDFTVMRNGFHVYHNYKNLPWLTCDEIKRIRDTIAGIIDGSITQNEHLCFIESDIALEFVFHDNEFSYANMSLGYWETEGRGCLTGNRLILCLCMYELEHMLSYLQSKTAVKED